MTNNANALTHDQILALVRRLELMPQLVRRFLEEEIISIVPLSDDFLAKAHASVLGEQSIESFLASRHWDFQELDLHVRRPEALRRFAEQRFGPGVEETFLLDKENRDQVIYSFLRVRNPSLVRELWIRIEEGETSFGEAAGQYSEGHEKAHKGLIGPLPMSSIHPPQLVELLRTLQPGSVSPPTQIGDWHVLVRLEQLTPARFDEAMRERLMSEQLDRFLQERTQRFLAGDALEPLHYDVSV